MRLRLKAGNGPAKTRQALSDLVFTDIYRPSGAPDLSKKEFRMYWREFLSREDCDLLEREVTREKAEDVIKEFYSNDYWRLVNGIRVKLGFEKVTQ